MIEFLDRAVVAQWVHNPKVVGSSPTLATSLFNHLFLFYFGIAQWVMAKRDAYVNWVCRKISNPIGL